MIDDWSWFSLKQNVGKYVQDIPEKMSFHEGNLAYKQTVFWETWYIWKFVLMLQFEQFSWQPWKVSWWWECIASWWWEWTLAVGWECQVSFLTILFVSWIMILLFLIIFMTMRCLNQNKMVGNHLLCLKGFLSNRTLAHDVGFVMKINFTCRHNSNSFIVLIVFSVLSKCHWPLDSAVAATWNI